MSAEHEHNGQCHAFHEKLDIINDEFEQVELEIIRINDKMTRDLYAKREKVISEIPNFWPRVFEQAPPEIFEYIQPTDAVIITALKNLTVERFELPNGHPRSFSLKFEFSENGYFENSVLEKKFWWRCAKNGQESYVSEPVEIKWKPGKDLTHGLLDLAKKIYEEDKAGKSDEKSPAKEALVNKLDDTSIDTISFFNMFGYRGRYITAENSATAFKELEEKRKAHKEGKPPVEEMEDDDDDDDEDEYEIYPNADELAVAIAEDLYPDAIRYFQECEQLAMMSDSDSDY
ncbi:related to phosphatase 2a inhibitor [Claviceps purpurea 20.1]|uniref:Related to phosphatase 2a inhibitor n=1 Tax=Claviceps purpurea (strain 20.1) TaxID=1111077 RepID=M1VXD6_CLAP2|nr:related to phosphatase 2a inhibitor [Claviceps purpurea 20.1]